MKRFYLINKTQRDKSGIIISGHKTFVAAEAALKRVNSKVTFGKVPAIIIESDKVFRNGQEVNPGDY